jgi:hypothetical protein
MILLTKHSTLYFAFHSCLEIRRKLADMQHYNEWNKGLLNHFVMQKPCIRCGMYNRYYATASKETTRKLPINKYVEHVFSSRTESTVRYFNQD